MVAAELGPGSWLGLIPCDATAGTVAFLRALGSYFCVTVSSAPSVASLGSRLP